MADFTATAISKGDHWVIDVPGVASIEVSPRGRIKAGVVEQYRAAGN
jgi:hypothetical protein